MMKLGSLQRICLRRLTEGPWSPSDSDWARLGELPMDRTMSSLLRRGLVEETDGEWILTERGLTEVRDRERSDWSRFQHNREVKRIGDRIRYIRRRRRP